MKYPESQCSLGDLTERLKKPFTGDRQGEEPLCSEPYMLAPPPGLSGEYGISMGACSADHSLWATGKQCGVQAGFSAWRSGQAEKNVQWPVTKPCVSTHCLGVVVCI